MVDVRFRVWVVTVLLFIIVSFRKPKVVYRDKRVYPEEYFGVIVTRMKQLTTDQIIMNYDELTLRYICAHLSIGGTIQDKDKKGMAVAIVRTLNLKKAQERRKAEKDKKKNIA